MRSDSYEKKAMESEGSEVFLSVSPASACSSSSPWSENHCLDPRLGS